MNSAIPKHWCLAIAVWLSAPFLLAQYRPLSEVHPESLKQIINKLGYSPWVLVGNNPSKPLAQASILRYEEERLLAIRRANLSFQQKGAACDELKARAASTVETAEAAARAIGLSPMWKLERGKDLEFDYAMLDLHRQLRVEFARFDMLQANLNDQLVAEARRQEQAKAAARQSTHVASTSGRAASPRPAVGQAWGGFDDSTVFLLGFSLLGLVLFGVKTESHGFLMMLARGTWVLVLLFVSLGYFNGGPQGAAVWLGKSLLAAPGLGIIYAAFGSGKGGAEAKPSRGETFPHRLGFALGLTISGLIRVLWIPVLLFVASYIVARNWN
jgi:hypothetical protein